MGCAMGMWLTFSSSSVTSDGGPTITSAVWISLWFTGMFSMIIWHAMLERTIRRKNHPDGAEINMQKFCQVDHARKVCKKIVHFLRIFAQKLPYALRYFPRNKGLWPPNLFQLWQFSNMWHVACWGAILSQKSLLQNGPRPSKTL